MYLIWKYNKIDLRRTKKKKTEAIQNQINLQKKVIKKNKNIIKEMTLSFKKKKFLILKKHKKEMFLVIFRRHLKIISWTLNVIIKWMKNGRKIIRSMKVRHCYKIKKVNHSIILGIWHWLICMIILKKWFKIIKNKMILPN